jgi:hypothetical protein
MCRITPDKPFPDGNRCDDKRVRADFVVVVRLRAFVVLVAGCEQPARALASVLL